MSYNTTGHGQTCFDTRGDIVVSQTERSGEAEMAGQGRTSAVLRDIADAGGGKPSYRSGAVTTRMGIGGVEGRRQMMKKEDIASKDAKREAATCKEVNAPGG